MESGEEAPKELGVAVPIPRAVIGRFGKELSSLTLRWNATSCTLTDKHNKKIVSDWQWSKITALSLDYDPFKLHKLVIEVNTQRRRESTGEIIDEPFLILYFESKYIPLIESEISTQKLQRLASRGIPSGLLPLPFCLFYHPLIRSVLQLTERVVRTFLLLCFVYSLVQYFYSCKPTCPPGHPDCPEDLKSCTTLMGLASDYTHHFFHLGKSAYLDPLHHFFNEFRVLSLLLSIFSLVFLMPIWASLLLWALLWYLADFVVNSTLTLLIFQSIGSLIQDFKFIKGTLSTIIKITKILWRTGRRLYLSCRKQPDPPKPKTD